MDIETADSLHVAVYIPAVVVPRAWELQPGISPPPSRNSMVSVISRLPESDVVRVAVYVTLWSYVDGLVDDDTMMLTGTPPGIANAEGHHPSVTSGTATAAVSPAQLRNRPLRRVVTRFS